MKKQTKPAKPTRAELERKLLEALAGQAHVYGFASREINKGSTEHMIGSGVILTLTALGGREIIKPVLIRDGLSKELIEAIRADLTRSYEAALMFNPRSLFNRAQPRTL